MAIPAPRVLSWPLGGVDGGRLTYSANEQSVREVMLNILLTRPGERLMRPDFGAGLLDFIHQPNNETTRHMMADVVRKSIARYEPRIEVEEVEVLPHPDSLSEVHVTIRYHMRHTKTQLEFSLALDLGQVA